MSVMMAALPVGLLIEAEAVISRLLYVVPARPRRCVAPLVLAQPADDLAALRCIALVMGAAMRPPPRSYKSQIICVCV